MNKVKIEQVLKAVQDLTLLVDKKEDHQRDKKEKGKKATKLRKRDGVTPEIYEQIILSLNTSKFIGQRDFLVFKLLWALGLRINELRFFTSKHWLDLCEKGWTQIFEPKRNQTKDVTIAKNNQNELNSIKWAKDFWIRKGDAPLLSNSKGQPLRNLYAIDYYNKKLKPFGTKFNLIIQTHSFRIGLITHLLQTTDSNVVRDILGHKDLRTTLRYNRGTTPLERKQEALNKIR